MALSIPWFHAPISSIQIALHFLHWRINRLSFLPLATRISSDKTLLLGRRIGKCYQVEGSEYRRLNWNWWCHLWLQNSPVAAILSAAIAAKGTMFGHLNWWQASSWSSNGLSVLLLVPLFQESFPSASSFWVESSNGPSRQSDGHRAPPWSKSRRKSTSWEMIASSPPLSSSISYHFLDPFWLSIINWN